MSSRRRSAISATCRSRALATLAAADAILAEDTRVTRKLLDRYDIAAPLVAYHEHNAAEMRPRVLARLAAGEALALVSDAGTPLVSDPGYKLVVEAAAAGATVISLPGPCAAIAALTTAALPTDRFFFEGFLPAKAAARRERIAALATIPATLILYEAPGRLAETLADLAAGLGARPAAVARELTKLHEETRRGDLVALAAHYVAAGAPKGEIVIVVGPPQAAAKPVAGALDAMILEALAEPVGQGRRRRGGRRSRPAAARGLRARAAARRIAQVSPARPAAARRRAHIYGLRAEWVAALLLRLKGYRVLDRRFAAAGGEIDLVARRGATIAFVEVKARDELDDRGERHPRRQAPPHRPRGARLAGAQPVGGGLQPARRRRVRRAGAASPPPRRGV